MVITKESDLHHQCVLPAISLNPLNQWYEKHKQYTSGIELLQFILLSKHNKHFKKNSKTIVSYCYIIFLLGSGGCSLCWSVSRQHVGPMWSFGGSEPCLRVPRWCSEGVWASPPTTRTPSMFCSHRDFNPEPSASQLIISCILIEEINYGWGKCSNFLFGRDTKPLTNS